MTPRGDAMPALASRAGIARIALFSAGVLAFFLVVEDFAFLSAVRYQALRKDVANPAYNTLVYVATYALCTAALVVLYCHAWRAVRGPAEDP